MAHPRFEPLILKWAREKRFGPKIEILETVWQDSWREVSPDLVRAWENGSSQPTFAQARKLAEIYKRPLAVFFLASPPDEKQNPPDLRTIGSHDNEFLSPEALLVIRKARRIQEISVGLSEDLGERPSFKYRRCSLSDDPAELGERIRNDLSVSIHDQFGSKRYEDFFEHLRSKIESTGVITLKSGLHDSFPIADCRAFSFTDQLPYLILVNNKDTEGAKNFSLLHEFAHIFLREAGICNNFRSFGARRGANPVEAFCNQFAANFLVPKEHLVGHRILSGRTKVPPEEVDSLSERLALAFKVSRVVILRRLIMLDYVPSSLYATKTKAWGDESPARPKKGGTFSLKTTLMKNGLAFSSLVLEAYRKNKISYAGVSDYLGLKTKHLPGFEKLIDLHAAR